MNNTKVSRFKYEGIGKRTDCVSYKKVNETELEECDALTCLLCKKEMCSFYKPKNTSNA